MFCCCSLGSQLFCAKTAAQEFALVGRERANPITTLNESTLCSKIETHRRQIKTRKTKSNEKSCTNRLLCRTQVYVWVVDWGTRVNVVGFPQAENIFMAQGIDYTLISFDCVGSHTLDTHSTDFSLRHALHVIFPYTAFRGFISRFSQTSCLQRTREEKKRFSSTIFQVEDENSRRAKKKWQKFFSLPSILSFYILQSQMEEDFSHWNVLTINGFPSDPKRSLSRLSSKTIKRNYQMYGSKSILYQS